MSTVSGFPTNNASVGVEQSGKGGGDARQVSVKRDGKHRDDDRGRGRGKGEARAERGGNKNEGRGR